MRSYEREYIEKVISHVEKDVGAKHLLSQLSMMAYMGETKFKALFREYMKQSFHQWLIQIRMNYAVELLKYSDLTLKQISKKTGYGQERNFCKAFKKRFKASPGAWRKANGSPDD